MKSLSILGFTAFATAGLALGQAVTTPVGYVTIECKANSDTIVGVPMRQYSAYAGTLDGDPAVAGGFATLTLAGTPGLTEDAFANTHYVKFKNTEPAEAGDGQWFVVTSNTPDTLTVNLNGGTIDAVSGAALEVLKLWTLNELFNPADSTNDPNTTGNAIVTSLGIGLSPRRTQILIPDLTGVGINLAPTEIFYLHEDEVASTKIWRKPGINDQNFGSYQLWPDTYFIIRHPVSVVASTFYTATGEVEVGDFSCGLSTRATESQDNFVALPRPVDTKLDQLNLGNTAGFMPSTSTGIAGRRDQLLLFDNTQALRNKSASKIYYYFNGWKSPGDIADTPHRGNEIIPAGSGFIIRKYKSGTGATAYWNNTPGY